MKYLIIIFIGFSIIDNFLVKYQIKKHKQIFYNLHNEYIHKIFKKDLKYEDNKGE